jgi:hypothetical protein
MIFRNAFFSTKEGVNVLVQKIQQVEWELTADYGLTYSEMTYPARLIAAQKNITYVLIIPWETQIFCIRFGLHTLFLTQHSIPSFINKGVDSYSSYYMWICLFAMACHV